MAGASGRKAALEGGDVLLFPEPKVTRSWEILEQIPEPEKDRRKLPKDRKTLQGEFAFHQVIACLDNCSYTHAALVLDVTEDGGPWIANSDEHHLRRIRLSDLEWEYPDPILVRRVKPTYQASDPEVVSRCVDAAGRAVAGLPTQYPYIDMLPTGHLLAARNRPVDLPFLPEEGRAAVQQAIRAAADRLQRDEHLLAAQAGYIGEAWRPWYEEVVGVQASASEKRRIKPTLTFMCAAFVVEIFRLAGLEIRAPIRTAPPAPGPTAVSPAWTLQALAAWISDKVYLNSRAGLVPGEDAPTRANRSTAAVLDELRTALEYGTEYLQFTNPSTNAVADWEGRVERAWSMGGSPVAGSSGRIENAAAQPIVPMFATAYDLLHCDELEDIGQLSWQGTLTPSAPEGPAGG